MKEKQNQPAVENVNKVSNKATATTEKVAAADKLQAEIELKTKELQKCLAELERKKQLSDNRTKFIEALDALGIASEKLSEEDSFETKAYRLTFSDIAAYRDESIFKISNTAVLREVVAFMQSKVKERIAEIEKQLIEA